MSFENLDELEKIIVEEDIKNEEINKSKIKEENNDILLQKYDEIGIPKKVFEKSKTLINYNKDIFNNDLFFNIAEKLKNKPNEIEKLSTFYDFLNLHRSSILKGDFETIIPLKNEYKEYLIDFWKAKISVKILEHRFEKNHEFILENDYNDLIEELIETNYDINNIEELVRYYLTSLKNDIDKIEKDDSNNLDKNKAIKNIKLNYKKSFESIVKSLTTFKIDENFYEKTQVKNEKIINLGIKQFLEKGGENKTENWAKNIYNFGSSYNKKINKDENLEQLNLDDLIIELKKNNKNYFNKKWEDNLRMQMNFIDEIYKNKQIKQIEHIKLWKKNEFPSWKKKIKGNNKKLQLEYMAKTVAVISIANKIFLENNDKKGYYLRQIQIIAILLFISKKREKGLIEEIGTGEGKTTIIFTLAIYLGLMDHYVDIFTSASNLAKRDAEEFKELYGYFDLTVDYCRDEDPIPYNAKILYGTFFKLEGDFLREITKKKKIRNNRNIDAIIIDEVDNIFIDNIRGSTQLVNGSLGYDLICILYIYIYMFVDYTESHISKYIIDMFDKLNNFKNFRDELLQLMEDPYFKKEIFKNMKPFLKELISKLVITKNEIDNNINNNNNSENILNNLKIIIPTHLKELVDYQLDKWINNAYRAKYELFMDKDYVKSKINGRIEISPVDKDNTGEIEISRVYSNGLHQFLQLKEKLRIKDERLTHTFLSHISFFYKYMKKDNPDDFYFYGMTGTLGDDKTKDIYQKQFKANILIIPSFMPKRFVELPPILCTEDKIHLVNICEETIFQINSGRKVLIICNTIEEAKKIRENLHDKSLTYQIALYTRDDTEDKNSFLKEENQVIIATNLAGRGTDIVNDIEVEKMGGLHVILTFMPSNLRVERQAFGRTARKGNKGSGQMILKCNRFSNIEEYKNERNRNEEKRLEKIEKEVKVTKLKDELFNKFCEIKKNKLNENNCLERFSNEIDERWGIFIKKYIDQKDNDELNEDDIRAKFDDFKTNLEKIIDLNDKNADKYKNNFLRAYDSYKNITDPHQKKIFNDIIIKNEYYSFAPIYYNIIANIIETNKKNENEINAIRERNKNKIFFKESEKLKYQHDSVKILNDLKSISEKLSKLYKYLVEPCLSILLSRTDYINSEIVKQFEYRKIIIFLITQQIRQNIAIMQEYEEKPLKEYVEIIVVEKKFDDLFQRISNEKNIDKFEQEEAIKFIQNMGLFNAYELNLKIHITKKSLFFRLIMGLFGVIGGIVSLVFLPAFPFVNYLVPVTCFGYSIHNFVMLYKINKTIKIKWKESEYYSNKLYIEIGKTINIIMPSITDVIMNSLKKTNNVNVPINEIQNTIQNIKENKEIPYIDKKYTEKSAKLSHFQNDFLEKLKEKITNEYMITINDCGNILNYLLFVDKLLENRIWKNKIISLFEKNFKIYFSKIVKEKENKENIINSIVSAFNIENDKNIQNSFDNSITKIEIILKKFFDKFKEEINNLFVIREYKEEEDEKLNEDEGLISLEQLIRHLNSDKIDKKFSEEIVSLLIKEKIIDNNGIFNDLILNKDDNNELSQIINLKIETKINKDNNTNLKSQEEEKKKNLDDLSLEEISKIIIIDDDTQNLINT